jgi:hypothetical protein
MVREMSPKDKSIYSGKEEREEYSWQGNSLSMGSRKLAMTLQME